MARACGHGSSLLDQVLCSLAIVMSEQADFGLSTSDAERSVTKARTGQLQVRMHVFGGVNYHCNYDKSRDA